MNCRQFEAYFASKSDEEPSWELLDHAEQCQNCASLLSGPSLEFELSSQGPIADFGMQADTLWSETAMALEREGRGLARLRNLTTRRRVMVSALGLSALVTTVGLLSYRADWKVLPMDMAAVQVLPLLGLIAVCVVGILRPRTRPDWKPGWGLGLFAVAVAMSALPIVLAPLHVAHAESLLGEGGQLLPRALTCLIWGSVVGALSSAWLFLFHQGKKNLKDLSPTAGAFSVASSTLLLGVHCPLTSPLHLLLGHFSIAVLVGVAGVCVTGVLAAGGRQLRGG